MKEKERIDKIKNGESVKIKFKSNKRVNLTKDRFIRLIIIVCPYFVLLIFYY